jgi:hypothetical protein
VCGVGFHCRSIARFNQAKPHQCNLYQLTLLFSNVLMQTHGDSANLQQAKVWVSEQCNDKICHISSFLYSSKYKTNIQRFYMFVGLLTTSTVVPFLEKELVNMVTEFYMTI